jgi:hypothetical protein
LTIYKQEEEEEAVIVNNGLLEKTSTFAVIIFGCDGVLIDSANSCDLVLEQCVESFASVLGFRNNIPSRKELASVVRNLQNLATFNNNDWDSLAVLVGYFYARLEQENRSELEKVFFSGVLAERSYVLNAISKEGPFPKGTGIKEQEVVGTNQLSSIIARTKTGSTSEEIISNIFSGDRKLVKQFYDCVGYPQPAGKGFLATYFGTIMYGSELFEKNYGTPSPLRSSLDLISNEKVLLSERTLSYLANLCNGKFGILTGRPFIPTAYTMGTPHTR